MADQSKNVFCDSQNISHCTSYISEQLLYLGLSPLTGSGNKQCDNVTLLNSLYDIIKLYNSQRLKEFMRCQSDFEFNQREVRRLREKLEKCERTLQTETEKNQQLSVILKANQTELKSEKDDSKCLQNIFEQKDSQFHHEVQCKDKEIATLKEYLHQMMKELAEKRLGMMTLNALPHLDANRSKWQTKTQSAKNEEDRQWYEGRNKILFEETLHLKRTLFYVYTSLESVKSDDFSPSVKCDDSGSINIQESEETLLCKDGIIKYFSSPYLQLKDEIESAFEKLISGLRTKLRAVGEIGKLKGNEIPTKQQHTGHEVKENGAEKLCTSLQKAKHTEEKRVSEWQENQGLLSLESINSNVENQISAAPPPFNKQTPNGSTIDDFNQMLLDFERDLQDMMSSVVRLRKCNWSRAVSPPVTNNESLLTEDIPTEAVFYGPDGQPLTAEEALFLETCMRDAYNETHYDGYQFSDGDDSEGMDEEIAAAYEEFLRFSGQQ